jgi:predicted ATPase
MDTEIFQKQIEIAQELEEAGHWSDALERYESALTLYQGDYLIEDPYEQWALAPRAKYRELYLTALFRTAECQARLGQYRRAIEQCNRVIELQPTSEYAYRQKMLYHHLAGERNAALQTYRECVKMCKEHLDVEPSPDTQKLQAQILKGEIPGIGEAYPKPISVGAPRHNLPSALTSFIGRERETLQIQRLLKGTRLLTLTGAGGCGKTRLALQIATSLLERYADGVWLVELASLTDPALVTETVATALGVREAPGCPLIETLSRHLRSKQLLLILDNCEHLAGECAKVAEALLRACPDLQILATCRGALHISGETVYQVPPLSIPDAQPLPALKILREYEVVSLFCERALASQPEFVLTRSNAQAVVQICRRLDGLPLAIELAVAWVRVLSVEEIAVRLDDSYRLLVSHSQTALPHQETLQAAMDWSFQLLSEGERALLRRVSVFRGGCTLEATEAVCAGVGIEARAMLDLVSHLVDQSLVMVDSGDGKTCYRLLETVRQYSQDKL